MKVIGILSRYSFTCVCMLSLENHSFTFAVIENVKTVILCYLFEINMFLSVCHILIFVTVTLDNHVDRQ